MPLQFISVFNSITLGKLEDESYVQVVGSRIRHIKREKNSAKQLSIKNKVVLATCSGRQLFVALFGGEVMFLQLDREKDNI